MCAADRTLGSWEDGTPMRLENVIVHFNLVVLRVWFLDQQHQGHLGTWELVTIANSHAPPQT